MIVYGNCETERKPGGRFHGESYTPPTFTWEVNHALAHVKISQSIRSLLKFDVNSTCISITSTWEVQHGPV